MKIWLDDVALAPSDHVHIRSISEIKDFIDVMESKGLIVETIDCRNELCNFDKSSGEGVEFLDWLLEREPVYNVKVHTCSSFKDTKVVKVLERLRNKNVQVHR